MNRAAAVETQPSPGGSADRSSLPPGQSADAIEALQNFRVIFRAVRRHFHEVEERCGISGSQLWALSVVVQAPGIRVKDLARSMAVQQSTASNLVEQLVRQGLIRRARESTDQRIVQLHPDRSGRAGDRSCAQATGGHTRRRAVAPGSKRLATLNRLLDEVVKSMRSADRSARHLPLADL